jgi:hypothetical protein
VSKFVKVRSNIFIRPLILPSSYLPANMPPPKMQLMPGIKTRAANKDKHPGRILLGNARRTAEEMNQIREEAVAHREAEEQRLTRALENIARIEDLRHDNDNARELERRQRRDDLRQCIINYMRLNTYYFILQNKKIHLPLTKM